MFNERAALDARSLLGAIECPALPSSSTAWTPRTIPGFPVRLDGDFGPVLSFMQALWALQQGLNRRSKAMFRASGVTGPQRLVVLTVARLGPIAPGQLARLLHLHPASVTRLARTLEDRSLLRRRPHPRDRRQLLLEVAPRARRVANQRTGTVESAVRAALARAPDSEVKAAVRLIRRVAAKLGAK